MTMIPSHSPLPCTYWLVSSGIVTLPLTLEHMSCHDRGHYSGASDVPRFEQEARTYVAFSVDDGGLLRVGEGINQ